MTTKTKKEDTTKKSRIKVNKLKRDRQSVKELRAAETKQVQGGVRVNNLANLEALLNVPDN